MGIGLADENEVIVVEQGAATKGLMSIEVVAQKRVIAGVVEGAVLVQPALAGVDLAVLFGDRPINPGSTPLHPG